MKNDTKEDYQNEEDKEYPDMSEPAPTTRIPLKSGSKKYLTSPVLQKYLEEFDKKFANTKVGPLTQEHKWSEYTEYFKVKSFLRSLASAVREETIEEMREKVLNYAEEVGYEYEAADALDNLFQRAKLEKLK